MRPSAAIAFLIVCLVSPLGAQSADSARTGLVPGTYSLSFAVPGFGGTASSGSFGFWRLMSERTNLGFFVQVSARHNRTTAEARDSAYDRDTGESELLIWAGPAVRRYLATAERVAPFLYGSAQVGYVATSRHAEPLFRDRGNGVSGAVEAGGGLEWFPTRTVSLSGYTGVRASITSQEGRFTEGEYEATTTSIGTFTTALSVNIYFVRSR